MLNLTAKDIMTRDVVTIHVGFLGRRGPEADLCRSAGCRSWTRWAHRHYHRKRLAAQGAGLPPRTSTPSRTASSCRTRMGWRRIAAQSTLVEAMTKKGARVHGRVPGGGCRPGDDRARRQPRPIIREGAGEFGMVSRRDVIMALAKATNGANLCQLEDEVRTGRVISFD